MRWGSVRVIHRETWPLMAWWDGKLMALEHMLFSVFHWRKWMDDTKSFGLWRRSKEEKHR